MRLQLKCTAILTHRSGILPACAAVTLYGQMPGGPFFDDLTVGQVFDSAPSMTLTAGAAAVHQSILGDRMRLPLDAELTHGGDGRAAPRWRIPALVCDVAIGQCTLATQRVKANLFYRGLTFHRFPVIGDTLYTRTEVVGLKQNSAKPGRAPTGLAALRMTTIDQDDRLVLDFYRCAMLPLSAEADRDRPRRRPVGDRHRPGRRPPTRPRTGTPTAFRARVPGPHFDPALAGTVLHSTADVVSSAPELARLSLNIAATHHDSRVGGQRLVYGGHTIGLALAQASRVAAQPGHRAGLGVLRSHRAGARGRHALQRAARRGGHRPPGGRGGRADAAVAGLRGRRAGPAGAGLAIHRAAVLRPGTMAAVDALARDWGASGLAYLTGPPRWSAGLHPRRRPRPCRRRRRAVQRRDRCRGRRRDTVWPAGPRCSV